MEIKEQYAIVYGECPTDHVEAMKLIEEGGRVCYRTEGKIDDTSYIGFADRNAKRKHGAVWETSNMVVRTKRTSTFPLGMLREIEESFPSKFLTKIIHHDKIYVGGNYRAWMEHFGVHHPDEMYQKISELEAMEEVLNVDEIPWELKRVAVKLYTDRAVTHEMVRHRPASYLQECLSEDAEVKAFSSKRFWTMKELYRLFTTPDCGAARASLRVRVKNDEGEMVSSKVWNVTRSGVKKLFRITTKNGHSLKSSINHIYFTENGEKRLEDISVGERVWMNGIDITKEWLQEEYINKNRGRKEIANEIGMSDSWLGKLIQSYGLQKPKTSYPGRRGGYGVPGMHSEEGKKKISDRMKGENNHHWKGDTVEDGGGRSRANRMYDLSGELCVCGKPAEERHHIDRDPTNNEPHNIEYCCMMCHKARHIIGVKIAWLDEVISIEPCGEGMTYDLEVEHPSHNFVANGFIVHNSQRYVKYDGKMEFIEPLWYKLASNSTKAIFEEACLQAESYYMELRKTLLAEDARVVLPNACATTIFITADLPEWNLIFGLRTVSGVYPPTKQLARDIQSTFKEKGWTYSDNFQRKTTVQN